VISTTPPPRTVTSDGNQGDGDHIDGRRVWMPMMDFPYFDGADVRVWINKCSAYFALYQIPSSFHVTAASIHLSGPAAHWFHTYKLTPGYQWWEQFVSAVMTEFEFDVHRSKTMELLNLKQRGTIDEYHKQFEQLVYHIKLYDHSLSTTMLTAQFLLGLKPELCYLVEMQLPDSIARATMLAAI
jgi:hypothetical protein